MQPMATAVQVLPEFRLALTYDDGATGIVDFTPLLFGSEAGIFAELRDPQQFAQVFIHPEWGHIEWPNGADLDPYVLYARATKTPVR